MNTRRRFKCEDENDDEQASMVGLGDRERMVTVAECKSEVSHRVVCGIRWH